MEKQRKKRVPCPVEGRSCTRALVNGQPHPGWCMGGHRFGRPRDIWYAGRAEDVSFDWYAGSPRHFHCEERKWVPMAPSPESTEGTDAWKCTGCELHVKLAADPGDYGVVAWRKSHTATPESRSTP